MADDDGGYLSNIRLSIMLIGMGSMAFVVWVYHCFSVGWCNRNRPISNLSQARPYIPEIVETPGSGVEVSTAQLIPAHKYEKGSGLMGDDRTCAICLCEFEEGEELRTLPECLHSYHVPCIDMWLHSHSNCPICRTDAAVSLSPQILRPPPPPLPPQVAFGSVSSRANSVFLFSSAIH
ncbi:hypothetical protein Dsin_004070 [Dipteronia sinensis]|uniref:RING-type E3 ubiquitin transferase n=1 Tax=Dipteronia sinensis TaxID=43782 RepID=A0AAE0BAP6_9ROSI|nr:hypothetical protein Dsin_004070 [Dipteronia sinensis]